MNWRWSCSFAFLTVALSASAPVQAVGGEAASVQGREWKTVEELSPQELSAVDLSTDTPRHPQLSYAPAEPYPFTAPYTAEEMGFRLMEFTQRPRWSCAFANLWGSISSQGVLMNPGRSATFMDYAVPLGVESEFLRKPGEEMYRYLNQNVAPPDAEGSQRMTIRYRTDRSFTQKEEAFMYSPSIRRVRHQAPFRREDKFPNQAQTSDDATGRDAWEFTWRLVGTDVLHKTVRFPSSRPTIVLGNGKDGTLQEKPTAAIKLMGDAYPHYTADGGVECYVVEARAREDWLPDYYAPRILYWLEKRSFYPLRIEQYGRDGKLAMVETRLTDMFNPALGDRGYGPLFILYWDIASDLMSYNIRDNHRVKEWTPDERQYFFYPDFMRRQWYLDTSIKSQAGVEAPEQFFLRPPLEEGKFALERPMQFSTELAARIQAQEAAGRLVFEVPTAAPVTLVKDQRQAVPPATLEQAVAAPTPAQDPSTAYAQQLGQAAAPTALR
ncbi:MAG: outer membrane lipoprotein-sorting protein [Deltaproteobacteria bacterium]|nr:outer membrane lipoprotein-sorting protein [Deltaproteobacteria bacterium]